MGRAGNEPIHIRFMMDIRQVEDIECEGIRCLYGDFVGKVEMELVTFLMDARRHTHYEDSIQLMDNS